jgi:hybrid cluster-associated redox disulfide protein
MQSISSDLSVSEIMRRWPATIRVFIAFRMNCVGCPLSCFHTIFDACEEHELDAACVHKALERAICPAGPEPG